MKRNLERTYLFVPGDRPERFEKAWSSAADAVIIDLEDAVSPDRKALARQCVMNWVDPKRPVWIRCNAIDTPWFEEDLAVLEMRGVQGVVLPKAQTLPIQLARLLQRSGLGIMPLIETAQGMQQVDEIASWPNVVRLIFGSIDFQVDLGIEGDELELLMFRSRLVLASKVAGLMGPVDGVSTEIENLEALRLEAMRGKKLGMTAKLCIHPGQVMPVHEVYEPTADQLAWAAKVMAAMSSCAEGAVNVDGKMVDQPILIKAQRLSSCLTAGDRMRA